MRVDEAVEFFGSQKALAEAIGISPSAVYQWGEQIPMSRRKSVRLAMQGRARDLEAEAIRLRSFAEE